MAPQVSEVVAATFPSVCCQLACMYCICVCFSHAHQGSDALMHQGIGALLDGDDQCRINPWVHQGIKP